MQSTLSKRTSLKGWHLSKADISDWLVPLYIHLICNQTLYKVDTSLRQTARAGPDGVQLRQSSLYIYKKNKTSTNKVVVDFN